MQTGQVYCSLYKQASPLQIPKSKVTSGPLESLFARKKHTNRTQLRLSGPVESLLARKNRTHRTQLRLSALAGSEATAMQNGEHATAALPANEGTDAAQPVPERGSRGESDANSHKLSNILDKVIMVKDDQYY